MDTSRLKALPLFEGVSDEDLDKLAPFVSEVSVSEGKHLVDEGGYAYDLWAIIEGTAQVIVGGEPVAELGAGDFFGEAGVLEKQQRNATVVAKTRMRLVTLTGWDLRRMRKQLGPVMDKLEQAIEQRRQPLPEG